MNLSRALQRFQDKGWTEVSRAESKDGLDTYVTIAHIESNRMRVIIQTKNQASCVILDPISNEDFLDATDDPVNYDH